MKTTVSISDTPQGGSENFRTAAEHKLLLNAFSINVEKEEVTLRINQNLQHYDENHRGGQWFAYVPTKDTHCLTLKSGDAPQQITVDGTVYAISVLGVSEQLNKRGQYRYAELEISW
jgi:hypothetical protein